MAHGAMRLGTQELMLASLIFLAVDRKYSKFWSSLKNSSQVDGSCTKPKDEGFVRGGCEIFILIHRRLCIALDGKRVGNNASWRYSAVGTHKDRRQWA